MKITLRTFGTFAEAIGARETALDLSPGERIGGLLEKVCGLHPALRKDLFDAAGQIKPYLIILKNGRSVSSLQQLETVIDAGDTIALFPPVGGG